MGGSSSPPAPTVVQLPSQQQATGSGEVKPFEPVIPFITRLLPKVEQTFSEPTTLFNQSLIPADSSQTLAARQGFQNVGQTAANFAPQFGQLGQADFQRSVADPSQDSIFLAEQGAISDQARQLTEQDKQLAQEQAIQAGQFGMGSTALSELQARQEQIRNETVQRQLAESLGRAEQRRIGAQARVPDLFQQQLQAEITPSQLQEAIGRDVEARAGGRLADQARLTQQGQEAKREQTINLANLLGGLAGLGTSTTFQNQSSGFTSGIMGGGGGGGGGSGLATAIGAAGTAAKLFSSFSDRRLKTNIKQVGKLDSGIKLYTWKWTAEAKKIVNNQSEYGVIADEVLEIMPEAVQRGTDGYLRVDYAAVGA